MTAAGGGVQQWGSPDPGSAAARRGRSPASVAALLDALAEQRTAALFAVLVALLLTAFPWVTADGGGESSVVNAGKLGLLLAATAAAVGLCELRVPPLGNLLVIAYAVVTAVAALAAGDPTGTVRSARLALVVVVVTWTARQLGETWVLRAVAGVASVVGGTTLAARAAGLPVMAADGRLNGFLPPMHPNILAALCTLGLIALVTLWLEEEAAPGWLALAPVLVAVIIGTGSRTSLLAGAVGVAVVLVSAAVRGRSRAVSLVLWLVASTAVVLAGASSSSLRAAVSAVLTRGGTAVIDPTFTGRTFVWAQAAQYNVTGPQRLVGNGLDVKALPRWLGDRYELQGIDSAWYSAWVSGGALGLGLLVVALLCWLVRSATASAPALAVVLAVALASPTESNLADVSYSLVVAVAVTAALVGGRPRGAPAPPPAALEGAGPSVVAPAGRWLAPVEHSAAADTTDTTGAAVAPDQPTPSWLTRP